VSALQAGVGANFAYTLDQASQHIAHVIAECNKQGVKTVEPTLEAEQAWVNAVIESSKPMLSYFANCTPSYFNNEGSSEGLSEKSGTFGGGANAWAKLLEEWRGKGGMEGLEIIKQNHIAAKL
jgi:cyclohexanone monooxygenase